VRGKVLWLKELSGRRAAEAVKQSVMDSMPQAPAWCRLVFDDARPALLLRGKSFAVGRAETNDLVGEQLQLSGSHCTLRPEGSRIMLTDTSSNGTFVNGEKVHRTSREVPFGARVEVVKGKQGLCFVVRKSVEEGDAGAALPRHATLAATDADLDKTVSDEEDKATAAVSAHMTCCICIKVMHKPVTLVPCQHNFCAGCYSDAMEHSDVCPQCRSPVDEITRNHTLVNIIESFLDANPSLKRHEDDLKDLDARDKLPAEGAHCRARDCLCLPHLGQPADARNTPSAAAAKAGAGGRGGHKSHQSGRRG
jgi:hypothetical protein